MRCSAYCIASSITTVKLFDHLKVSYNVKRFREVIHVKLPTNDQQEGDVFIFPYASIVCWGLTEDQEQVLLSTIRVFEVQAMEVPCFDEFTYVYGTKANIIEDEITLPDHEILTKLAFSHGIAQSVKLDSFEQTIQKTVDLTRELPHRMATQGKINLSGKQLQRMMGRLFIDRHSINLHQELLDTPEFFWEYSELEPIYKLTAHYLDRERRVNVLNQRLTVLKEMFDMLNDQYNHKQSAHLEWAVIWLIAIEVTLALAKDIFHLI
ncbi:MAG TPA: RMD1 family protein [Gammaproteobacteria bacterium]|nr:RMD1 family protein [Gammaproteobacteria bacterium]